MNDVTTANFGPLVSYLVPGATILASLSWFIPFLQRWFASSPGNTPTVGGFLYVTIASIAVGMTVSAIRWAIVDQLHRFTGVPPPRLNFKALSRNVDAFTLLIEIHYKHYLFYANMFVATAIAYACYRVKLGRLWPLGWIDLGVLLLEIVFFLTSRDTLAKYYSRSIQLFAASEHSATSA
jgi:hypothetical protein